MRVLIHWFSGADVQLERLAGTWLFILFAAVLICFFVSEITRNYSQVDKLWSLMPVIYSLVTLVEFPSPRTLLMTILVTMWGFRLSYNFNRKGGYNIIPWKGEEDYRWKIMRGHPVLKGRIRFGLFNLFFISFYQHFLIMLFSTPLLMAAGNNDAGLNILDFFASFLMLFFIILETVADNQLFMFHKLKKAGITSDHKYGRSLNNGFMVDGLWRYTRHPNFLAEQAIWISFYLFSIAASGIWINWSVTGALLLILLFQGSTALTERISGEKYPEYAAYKKVVPKFLPEFLLFRRK